MGWFKDNVLNVLGVLGGILAMIGSAFGAGLYINNKIKVLVKEELNEMNRNLVLIQGKLDTAVQEKPYNKDMSNISELVKEFKDDISERFDHLTNRIDSILSRGV